MLIVVMGVSGSGKSTVARALAAELGWEFLEGDNFHSPQNIQKMSAGIALTDEDRMPWLSDLTEIVASMRKRGKNAVLACSALKEKYRAILRQCDDNVQFVWLRGSQELISKRLSDRTHFMNPKLLASQFETLEEPPDALAIDIEHSTSEIVTEIVSYLTLQERMPHGAS